MVVLATLYRHWVLYGEAYCAFLSNCAQIFQRTSQRLLGIIRVHRPSTVVDKRLRYWFVRCICNDASLKCKAEEQVCWMDARNKRVSALCKHEHTGAPSPCILLHRQIHTLCINIRILFVLFLALSPNIFPVSCQGNQRELMVWREMVLD